MSVEAAQCRVLFNAVDTGNKAFGVNDALPE